MLMAQKPSRTHNKIKRMRRLLFVGPTGVEKSTLINILINNSVTVEATSHSAEARDATCKQTAVL